MPFRPLWSRLSNSCSSWVAFSASKSWTLNAGDGNRTVYVWFKDEFQNTTTAAATDSIFLDSTLPKDGSLSASVDDGEVALTWVNFSDKHSGLASYKLVFAPGTTAPATCAKGTSIYEGTDLTYTHESLTNGNSYSNGNPYPNAHTHLRRTDHNPDLILSEFGNVAF